MDRGLKPTLQHDQIGHDLKVIDPRELPLHGVCAAGAEQAGHGPFFVLADN